MIATLLNISLFANKTIDKNILDYETSKISSILKRQKIVLNDVNIVLKKDLQQNGWYGYVFDLAFTVKGKELTQKDTLFTNGDLITSDLTDIKTQKSFKDMMYPKLSKKYFDKSHLIAGNIDAKHTLVLFSDPLCPICLDEVPSIIKNVMKNPESFSLYYYHLPLEMHPTAKVLSKASIIATKMGLKDVDYKVYITDFSNFYNAYEEKDNKKALLHFNKIFETKITMAQINDSKLDQKLKNDMKMSEDAFVSGTPTLFLDGEIDKSRMKYEQYLK
jgi:protein-disulfide isomerase